MLKNVIILVIVSIFIFSAAGVYAASEANQPTAQSMESTKTRASRAMNNMLYGPVEVAGNLNETGTKGTKIDKCSEKTRSGVERGIARFVGGVWQLATFWYSDPNISGPSSSSSSSTK